MGCVHTGSVGKRGVHLGKRIVAAAVRLLGDTADKSPDLVMRDEVDTWAVDDLAVHFGAGDRRDKCPIWFDADGIDEDLGNLGIVLQGLQGTQTDKVVNGAFDDVADPVFIGDAEIGAHFMGDTVDLAGSA